WGCDAVTAARRLCPAGAIYFAMDENEVRRIFQHECCMVGSDGLPNDAHPHPRLWGSFTRVLGRYVREAELLTLEAAVAKMTALPARVFGLADRGRLAVGAWADVVVFDADTVCDRATWDAPTLASAGIEHVLVNGCAVFPQAPPSHRPGRILRRDASIAGAPEFSR
ncbi:N-acyl-D-glutamate deacylase, partial [Achromobacter xylosoxidans]